MGTDMGDISTNHNDNAIPTMTGAPSITEGTHHIPHPATTMTHAALQLVDAPSTTQEPVLACEAQLSQKHYGQELPVSFLTHIHGHPVEMKH